MDSIQPVLAALVVLGLLGAALYVLRKKGMAQFRTPAFGRHSEKQMHAIERLTLTPQHSLHLVSVGERTLLVATSPGGCSVVDTAPVMFSAQEKAARR
jgi:flagellar biogenesis protein FliO